jgi:hypothetical protein
LFVRSPRRPAAGKIAGPQAPKLLCEQTGHFGHNTDSIKNYLDDVPVILVLAFQRVVGLALLFFTDYPSHAYNNNLLLPLTTLAYAWMVNSHGILVESKRCLSL